MVGWSPGDPVANAGITHPRRSGSGQTAAPKVSWAPAVLSGTACPVRRCRRGGHHGVYCRHPLDGGRGSCPTKTSKKKSRKSRISTRSWTPRWATTSSARPLSTKMTCSTRMTTVRLADVEDIDDSRIEIVVGDGADVDDVVEEAEGDDDEDESLDLEEESIPTTWKNPSTCCSWSAPPAGSSTRRSTTTRTRTTPTRRADPGRGSRPSDPASSSAGPASWSSTLASWPTTIESSAPTACKSVYRGRFPVSAEARRPRPGAAPGRGGRVRGCCWPPPSRRSTSSCWPWSPWCRCCGRGAERGRGRRGLRVRRRGGLLRGPRLLDVLFGPIAFVPFVVCALGVVGAGRRRRGLLEQQGSGVGSRHRGRVGPGRSGPGAVALRRVLLGGGRVRLPRPRAGPVAGRLGRAPGRLVSGGPGQRPGPRRRYRRDAPTSGRHWSEPGRPSPPWRSWPAWPMRPVPS